MLGATLLLARLLKSAKSSADSFLLFLVCTTSDERKITIIGGKNISIRIGRDPSPLEKLKLRGVFTGQQVTASFESTPKGNRTMKIKATKSTDELFNEGPSNSQKIPAWTLDEISEADLGLLGSPPVAGKDVEDEVEILVQCPACQAHLSRSQINTHLDQCLD